MNDKKLAYSAFFMSCLLYLAVGYIMSYQLIVKESQFSNILLVIYDKLYEFDFLSTPYKSKFFLFSIVAAAVMIYGPKKDEKRNPIKAITLTIFSIILLFLSDYLVLKYSNYTLPILVIYTGGFLLSIVGWTSIFQLIKSKNISKDDPFNNENETFLQTEEKIENKYSVNIETEYKYKKETRKGWINLVNLFRALIVIGTPGSGKSFAIIEEVIEQLINKFFTLVIYDFKFDTLTRIAYNYWLVFKEKYKDDPEKSKLIPTFYYICFDNIEKSHRCNPIDPYLMANQTDASDAATSIMKNLNKEWIKKNDFFSRSAISFVSGMMWYLKKKSEELGKNLCTLPHVIILSTVNIEYLLEIMLKDLEVRNLMIPFKDALEREAGQQLSGQTASAQVSLSMLANRELFYVMSGNDFQLDINNPLDPKIISIQNNPDRSEVYAAPIGLYINKILQVVNKRGKRPLGLILDELPTIFIMNLRKIIDTGRSNLIATIIGIQSLAQMISDYGKELADVIFENCANIICGSSKGETARKVSTIFGKTHQEKTSTTISKNDVTTNISTQKDDLLPASKIASMSTGCFAGIVADEFKSPIKQKLFCGLVKPNLNSKEIQNDKELPKVRTFKLENHDDNLKQKLDKLDQIKFYDIIKSLNFQHKDYIIFYNDYIQEIAALNLKSETNQLDLIKTVWELKIFDHLSELKLLLEEEENEKQQNIKLKNYFTKLIDSLMIIDEKNRILNDNFMKIIKDIDSFVNEQYKMVTGKEPEFTIFDKNKIGDQIAATLEDNEEEAVNFMNDFNKINTKDILGMLNKNSSENESDQVTEEDSFSSYDIEF